MISQDILEEISGALKYFHSLGIPIDDVIDKVVKSALKLRGLEYLASGNLPSSPEFAAEIGERVGKLISSELGKHLIRKGADFNEANPHVILFGIATFYYIIAKKSPFGQSKRYRNIYDFLAEVQK